MHLAFRIEKIVFEEWIGWIDDPRTINEITVAVIIGFHWLASKRPDSLRILLHVRGLEAFALDANSFSVGRL